MDLIARAYASLRRNPLTAVALVIGGCLVAGLSIYNAIQQEQTAGQVTRIEHMPPPCVINTHSLACKVAIRHSRRACLHDEKCEALSLRVIKAARREVVAQSGSPPGQQPGGGQPPTPAPSPSPSPSPGPSPNPQPNPNPKPNPSPSPSPGPVKRITQTVCHLNPLGVRVCVQVPVG